MPTYIRLIRLSGTGRKAIREGKSIYEKAGKVFAENGGKVVASYATLGRYDFISTVEAPDDATMMKISALIAAEGTIKAETLPAMPTEEMVDSVG